jgi:hypothetical protein
MIWLFHFLVLLLHTIYLLLSEKEDRELMKLWVGL